jgi:hypothetical protein
MSSPISKALGSGFNASQIAETLMRMFPSYKSQISKALSMGYTAEQIVSFLEGGKKQLNKQSNGINTEFSQFREGEEKKRSDIHIGARNAGLMAATTLAAPFAGRVAGAAIQRALPQSMAGIAGELVPAAMLSPQTPTTMPQQTTDLEQPTPNVPSSQPPVNAPSIPQVANPVQPEGISTKPQELTGLANMLAPADEQALAENEKIAERLSKNSTVIAPQGVGEVKEIRNGKAIVEIDGKRHQVNEEDLESSPIPEKDLADLYEDVISGIEKTTGKQVSRNVEWAGYDPNVNELAYRPHGSDKLYVYEDISPEDVELLTSLLTQRKSTGQNFIGAWEAGTESPIGAAMYQLIQKLQKERGGKGNEYRGRYDTIYDALEPAKQALKRKHAERKKKAKKPRID